MIIILILSIGACALVIPWLAQKAAESGDVSYLFAKQATTIVRALAALVMFALIFGLLAGK